MELTVIGKPYARAIADIAMHDNSFDSWEQLLSTLSLIVEDEATKEFLSAPTISNDQKVSFFSSILEVTKGSKLSEKERNFINLLIENNKVLAARGIHDTFKSMDLANTKTITVKSAYVLSDEELKSITTQLSGAYDSEITITTEVDSKLQAGVIIKDGDKVVDLSMIARANALAARLSM